MFDNIPLLVVGKNIGAQDESTQIFEAQYRAEDPLINEHRIYNIVVVPGSLHLARLLYIMQNINNTEAFEITEINFIRPLIIVDGSQKRVQLIITEEYTDHYSFKVTSIDAEAVVSADNKRDIHAIGHLVVGKVAAKLAESVNRNKLNDIMTRCTAELNIDRFDKYFADNELQYQSGYKWFKKIQYGKNETLGFFRAPLDGGESQWLVLQAGQIDCSFQVLISIILDQVENEPIKEAWALAGIKHLQFFAKPQGKVIVHNRLTDDIAITKETRKVTSDISFYDEHANLIAEFTGVTVIKITKEKILALLNG